MSDEVIESPGAGRVLEVLVAVGTSVAAGDELLVIESMKMEIPVSAPRAGSIAALHVNAGAVVREREPLLILRYPGTHAA